MAMIPIKLFSILLLSTLLSGIKNGHAQQFDQLKIKVPADWSQQSRDGWISFSGKEPETGIFMEVRIFRSAEYTQKPDSSFRLEWAARKEPQFGEQPALPIRKRYNQSSLLYFEAGSEALSGSPKKYRHLYGFAVKNGIQTIELLTESLAEYKKLRYFLSDFLDGVELKNSGK